MDRIKKLLAAVFFAAALFALSTCDNPVDMLSEIEVKVMQANDRYLEVVSTIPVSEDFTVNPGTRIKIRFDRAINIDTVNTSTIAFVKHLGGTVVPWTASFDDLLNILSIRPDSLLSNFTRYDITVNGILGIDGSRIFESISWYFETTEAPTGQVVIANAGDIVPGYTKYSLVDISIINPNSLAKEFTAASSESALYDPQINGGSWAWTLISNPIEDFVLSAGQGSKYVYVVLKDSPSPSYSTVIDGGIVFDTANPSAGAWTINGNALYSLASTVGLTTTVSPSDATSGVYQMRFSNNNSSWSPWETNASSKTWDITSATYGGNANQGSKTVFVQIRDKAGNISSSVSDSISYDSVIPNVGTWRINGDAAFSSSAIVALAPTVNPTDATSGISQMRFSNNNTNWSAWEAYATSKSWDMTSSTFGGNTAQGSKTVYVQVKDGAGNVSVSASDAITYDTLSPNAPTISGISVPTYNNRTVATSVTWTWASGGNGGNGTYRYAFNGTPSGEGGTATSATRTTDGLWTLYVQERDVAGNWSPSGTRTIRMTPIIPYNGETNIPTTISSSNRMEWRESTLALEYRIRFKYQITTKLWSSWSSYIYTTDTSITSGVGTLPAATAFRWQIYMRNKFGWPAENETEYFTFTTQ